MAKMSYEGLDEFMSNLNLLSSEIHEINRGALGEGAGYVADQIKTALEGINQMSQYERNNSENKVFGATENELPQIIDNLGIKKFSESGGKIETSIGFGGYVNTPSIKFNNRIPTGMLVQCINYGNSFRQGTHTLDKVTLQVSGPVKEKIQDYIDRQINKLIN